ncbi:MAG TPA: PAS domain S-box protein [Bryobacteraceae bacterium]|nr:PAS domain S-box protein [Bryobacteraceae bacterium]
MYATRLRRFGFYALAIALVTLAVTAQLSFRNWQNFRQSTSEAERTRQLLKASRQVMDLVRDAETGQRGYLLTGRPDYLEPYHTAARALPGSLHDLAALAGGQPEQLRRARELESLIATKMGELERTISLQQGGRSHEALAIVLGGRGNRVMERIRDVSGELAAEELNRARNSEQILRDDAHRIEAVSVAGAALLTLLIGGALFAIQSSTAQRERLIADLERARTTAEETGDLLRTTLYSIGDAVITTDRYGRVRMMNAVAEKLTGYTEKEAEGQPIEAVFHIVNEQTRQEVESPVRRVLTEGGIVGLANHTVLISKNGTDVPLDDSGAPILDRNGALEGVVLVFRDITDRKRAQEELVRSEQQFRTVADAAPVMIWSGGPDGGREYFNKTWLDFTGRSPEQEAGDGWQQGIHPDDRERCLNVFRAAREAYARFSFEYRLRRNDGSYRWVLSQGVPRIAAGGTLLGYIGSVVDIEDRKLTEEKMRQAAKLESLGVLAGGIAHDFNNLLVGIMGNASLLEEYIAPASPARDLVDNLLKASERAAQLTRQMLAYSGRGRFYVELLDLSEQARQITTLVHASIPKNVTVRLALDSRLPRIQADAAQIHQLVMNLVINAAEAVGDAHGWVHVKTSAEMIDRDLIAASVAAESVEPGKYVVLSVTDNGAGMDEATRARIFDPFFTTKFTGRGLGLAAALGIVRGHKGGIHVHSVPGEGTTFQVFFPIAEAYQETAAAEPESAGGVGRILVVDDEEMVRETARKALARTGYDVQVAHDGKRALEILSGKPDGIDLVLLDMTMPEISGEETLPRIRAICPHVPVIATSGFNETEAMERFGKAIDGFIQKPYTLPQLARIVRELLARP